MGYDWDAWSEDADGLQGMRLESAARLAALDVILPDAPLDDIIAALDQGSRRVKELEAAVDRHKAEIKKRLEAAGFQKGQAYKPDGLQGVGVLYTSRKTDTWIDREVLILEGVAPAVVEKATKGGEDGTPFIQIQRPRAKKKKGDPS